MKELKHYKDPKQIIYGLNNHGLLSWMSDKANVKLIYRLRTGKALDLKNPETFNEKLQWLKVYDHNPRYTNLVDKVTAKQVVGRLIGEEHIVPIIKTWEKAEQIDLSMLPDQFVLKCNHDQGSVVIVRDKRKLNLNETVDFFKKRLKKNNYFSTREFGYKGIIPLVFAENFLGESIRDYKFYCFHGEPLFLYVGQGLTCDHSLKIDYFDLDWNPMPFYRTDYERLGKVPKPRHFEEMKEIAKVLSKDVPFVRIDLFEENSTVFFSEFTLCPASGFMPFVPEEYDRIIGSYLNIP